MKTRILTGGEKASYGLFVNRKKAKVVKVKRVEGRIEVIDRSTRWKRFVCCLKIYLKGVVGYVRKICR